MVKKNNITTTIYNVRKIEETAWKKQAYVKVKRIKIYSKNNGNLVLVLFAKNQVRMK